MKSQKLAPDVLNFVCMLWRKEGSSSEKTYTAQHVNTLEIMLKRETKQSEAKLWCVTDDDTGLSPTINTIELPPSVALLPGQYPKLWLTSYDFAKRVPPGEQFLFTDLDVVIVGDISTMVSVADPFRFRANYKVPCQGPSYKFIKPTWLPGKFGPNFFHKRRRSVPFSTCFYWFTAGYLRHVWDSFDLAFTQRIIGWTGTDQKWMNYVLGPRIPFWTRSPYFGEIRSLDRQQIPPDDKMCAVICSHKTHPWSPNIRKRNQWLIEKYPWPKS